MAFPTEICSVHIAQEDRHKIRTTGNRRSMDCREAKGKNQKEGRESGGREHHGVNLTEV